MSDWTWREKLSYYWRNCVKWYHRDDRNKLLTWALVASIIFVAVVAFGQQLTDLPRDTNAVEELAVPKALDEWECDLGYGMSWFNGTTRQTWGVWPCGDVWMFRYQEWRQSPDGLIWYDVKLREFWYVAPTHVAVQFAPLLEWVEERYPP